MSLPCAAEILTVKIDEMVPLPLHHKIRLNAMSMCEEASSSNYSDEELTLKSEVQLRAILVDFGRYFKENFSIILDENISSLEEDVSNAASYLFIRPLEFRMFLSGYQDLDLTVRSIIDRHSSLVDLSIKILNRDYDDCAEYLNNLSAIGIDNDSYLWWVSSLNCTIRDYIFARIYCSFV